MNIAKNSVKNGLVAAALVVICSAQVSLAGYTYVLSNNVGQVSASLGYSPSYTNKAITGIRVTNPSAGVTTVGTWTVRTNQPTSVSTGCTSTVQVLNIFGYKAVAKAYTTTGVSADASPELGDRLNQDGFVLTPNGCGSGYGIASGDETIDGQRYVVVLGNATGGTAVWFRGYIFDGTPTNRDEVIQYGIKLYDLVIKGPFDFGAIDDTNRCKALKIPIDYPGPNLYQVSDGVALSTTDLQFVNCPNGTITLSSCNPSYSNLLQTSGGCAPVSITYDPPSIAPGATATVTATATDASGNIATCQFTVSRPLFQISCPTSPTPIACGGPFPSLTTSGGCAPVNIVYNPPTNSIGPGSTLVTATATDARGNVATCQFTVVRPFLTFDGFDSPIGGTNGTCATPLRNINAGNKIPIKFDTLLCGVAYKSPTPPTVTITKLDTNTCTLASVVINNQFFQWVANQWHFNWNTLVSDKGTYRIEVNLGDGRNPSDNPFAIVKLQ